MPRKASTLLVCVASIHAAAGDAPAAAISYSTIFDLDDCLVSSHHSV
jgi:hypothetical protein